MFRVTKLFHVSLMLAAVSAQAKEYYVDATNGADSNPGSQAAPWKSISKVNATSFAAGDRIRFKRGETWAETLRPSSSGSSKKDIVYEDYGTGPLPRITGLTNEDCIAWFSPRSFLTFRNLHLQDCGQPRGKSKGGINVWNEGAPSRDILIEGSVIEGARYWNIYMTGVDGLTISNNVIRNAELEHGIYLDGTLGLHNATIEENEIYGNKGMCIQFNSNGVERLSGITLRYNKLHSCANGGVNNIGVDGLLAYHNLIYGNMPGIYNACDGADSGCRAGATGGRYYNNTIVTSGSGWATCFENGSSIGAPDFKEFKNNICVHNATRGPIFADEEKAGSAISDYNVFSAGSGASTQIVWNNRWYSNFAEYKAGAGQDSNGLSGDPSFMDAAKLDFRLSQESPAVDTGIDLGLGRDIVGNPVPAGASPDRGAFERLSGRLPAPTGLRLVN